MNEALLFYWHWFIAALVVFTLLGYGGLMLGHGEQGRLRTRAPRKVGRK